jgi:hypothetical protein
MVMGADRDDHGRYLPGHPGGPGRPRRAVEQDYLATLADAVPLELWRKIAARAAEDAAAGDPRARRWLSEHLLGREPAPLTTLAATELAGTLDDAIIARAAGLRGSAEAQKIRNRVFQYADLNPGRSAGRGNVGGGPPDPHLDVEGCQPGRNGHPG